MLTMMSEPEMTLAEVAASLRVSEDTAQKLLKQRIIPSRKQGRQWRVRPTDVEEYKQRLRQQQQN